MKIGNNKTLAIHLVSNKEFYLFEIVHNLKASFQIFLWKDWK
jgi:hypothetical protein